MKSKTPKQFLPLSNQPIWKISLLQCLKAEHPFYEVIIVSRLGDQNSVLQEATSLHPRVKVVAGGQTRQESSFIGITSTEVTTTHVVIHDAARPFVSSHTVTKHQELLSSHQAIDTFIPATDTIVTSTDKQTIDSIPNRSTMLIGQTPQSFNKALLIRAHNYAKETAASSEVTDDCKLMLNIGEKVYLVESETKNDKITTQDDYQLALAKMSLNQTLEKKEIET